MQEAVCTLCTSFGSWGLSGLFPFKGSAYGAYGRIRMTMESGLGPTARRHWSLFCLRKRQVHTAVHTAFPPCNLLSSPYRKRPAESPRRPGAGASVESPRIPHIHPFPSASSPATCPREAPICRSLVPLAGFRPKRRRIGGHRRHRPPQGRPRDMGLHPRRREAIRCGLLTSSPA